MGDNEEEKYQSVQADQALWIEYRPDKPAEKEYVRVHTYH